MKAKHTLLLLALVPLLCIAVIACGGDRTEIARVEATRTPAPAELTTQVPPTLTKESSTEVTDLVPTPTATASVSADSAVGGGNASPPTPSPISDGVVLDDLQKELFISFEGGGGPPPCIQRPAGPLPQAEVDLFDSPPGSICLWGFPTGSVVSVELYNPSGQFVATQEATVQDERDGVGIVDFPLTFAGQPTGEWTLLANASGMSLKASFRVGEPRLPRILILPPGSDVLSGIGSVAPNTYYVGDEVVIFGAGFPPARRLPLGIYYEQTGIAVPAKLVYAEEVQTDAQGRFEVHTPVEALALQGDGAYYATVPLDPSYEPIVYHSDPVGACAEFFVTSPG
jgi:hypothetical protein